MNGIQAEALGNIQILQTKLQPPPVQSNFLDRTRLNNLLDKWLERKLVLISAPAGFGKTSLVSHWIRQQDIPAAWFSADEDDQDPLQFLLYLVKAVQEIHPDAGEEITYFLHSPTAATSAKALLFSFINSLSKINEDFCIIIDDFHLIDKPAIQHLVTEFIEHLPERTHLILMSRSDPGLKLARLRSQHQMIEIRAADLSFTSEETADYLETAQPAELSQSDIQAINSRTEGWAAGIQLAAISLENRENTSEFIHRFEQTDRYVAEYLMEEVLQHQEQHIRKFLLESSILERLSAPLCKAVTRMENAEEILKYIEQSNLFIFPLDPDKRWFRYHTLFAELLQQRLNSDPESSSAELHLRAYQWFKNNEFQVEAIRHAVAGSYYDEAAQLLDEWVIILVKRSQFQLILRLTELLPEASLKKYPRLCIYKALAMFYSNYPLKEVMEYFQRTEQLDNQDIISGEVNMFKSLMAAMQGAHSNSAMYAEKALQNIPCEEKFLKSFAAGIRGLSYIFTGELDKAVSALKNSIEIAATVRNKLNEVVGYCHLAEIEILRGNLQNAADIYQKAVEASQDDDGNLLPVSGIALMGLSHIHLERYELDKAEEVALRGIKKTEKWAIAGTLRGYIVLIKIYQLRGELHKAEQTIQKARTIAADFDAMVFDDEIVEMIQAFNWLKREKCKLVERYLFGDVISEENGEFSNQLFPGDQQWRVYLYDFKAILLSRYYLRKGNAEQSINILQQRAVSAEDNNRIWPLIIIRILLARCYHSLDREEQAVAHLEKALILGQKGEFITAFLQEGKHIMPLLVQIRDNLPTADDSGEIRTFVTKLITLIEVHSSASKDKSEQIDLLSQRELEVLNCLALGMTNREIADSLYISLNTVRTHTKNIYDKLNVHTRTKAAARGKELGLI